ncbi:MAG: RNA-binding protein [Candidatus Poribacteria bacterium]|jgi:RNA recognition motif-containing protein
MNIYVGNLSSDVTGDDLRQAFGAFGQVESANVITDKFSGDSRGFGFVEMPSKDEATAALAGMNGKDIKGKAVSVNEAKPKTDRGGGGGRGGYGGGGGERGGYGGGGRSGDRGPRGGGGGGRRF